MQDGFLRAAAASIPVAVADPRRNAAAICARIDQAHRAHAALLVLPELCVTGYTCGGLFLSALLLDAAEEALMNICAHTQNRAPVVVLGVPLRAGGKLYNCAAVLHRGRILGVVPKTWLPNYDVFAEKRCFASAAAYHGPGSVPVSGADVPFGTGLVFACAQMPAFRLGVELCEDVWAPVPPSVRLCLAGATVIANCSASPEAAGKPAHRRTLLRAASARGLCGYVYANAGPDESSARAVFSAHHLIAENGDILAEHAPFAPEPGLLVTELDLLTLSAERRRNTTFVPEGAGARAVPFSMPLRPTPLSRAVSPHPFVPDDAALRRKRAELLLSIQAHGLRKRLLAAVPADRCSHLRQQSNGGCFEKRREYSAGQAGQLLQPVEKGQNGRKKRKRRQKAERAYQHAQAERQLRRLLFQKQADHAAKQRRRDQLSYRVHQNSNSVLTMSNSSAMRCTTIISTTTSAASEVMVACSSRPERTRT